MNKVNTENKMKKEPMPTPFCRQTNPSYATNIGASDKPNAKLATAKTATTKRYLISCFGGCFFHVCNCFIM